MDIGFSAGAALVGAVGALLHEASRWVSFRYEDTLPGYLRKLHYWILSAVLVALGAALAGILEPGKMIEALAIGVSAPALISRIGAAVPPKLELGGQKGHEATFRAWIKG